MLLKDAALAAAVALALGVPLVGLQAIEINAALGVRTRFLAVAVGVAVVFLGRLALRLSAPAVAASASLATVSSAFRDVAARTRRHHRLLRGLGVVLVLAVPILPVLGNYVDVFTTVVIYVMLGWGLNVVVGLAGLLDLGYVAFYAVGAYCFALSSRWLGLGFWEALPLGGLLAASLGVVLGFPVLRLRGDYLAIVTLGFGEIIHIILQNWVPVTGGPSGIGPIPAPTLFGFSFDPRPPPGTASVYALFDIAFSPRYRIAFLYYLVLALAFVANLFTLRLRRLPIGRAWEALREDEIACRALGINPTSVKLSAFAIGAMLAGFAGVVFAAKQRVLISPESFTFAESATILAIVVLGGAGSQLGIVLAATVLVWLPELGRQFAGVPVIGQLGELRLLLFGAAMVAIMVWRPRGLVARREPSLMLHGPVR
jgi:branched-chain amino acid transport system permease protein